MAHNQVIVIGGGLAGLSAAHTILERGGTVVVLDKSAFLGGNSTKATSGINGTYTQAQADLKIVDSPRLFLEDTSLSYHGGKAGQDVSPLVRTLTANSGPAVQWLTDKFQIDLSIVGTMGGQSAPRVHRGKERFPGMTITYGLMDALEKVEKATNGQAARIITKARATRVLRDASTGAATGVVYVRDGQEVTVHGPVIIATGGFGADFTPTSLLAKYRPDIMHLATTNGDHCTGDGIKMAEELGAGLVDMKHVQVHPTGLVHPEEPNSKIKFLAAEALRGTGALMLDGNGKRFCNELGRRDYCSNMMFQNKGPFRLVLNSNCAKEILWHCKHYQGRGLMKHMANGAALAAEIGIPEAQLKETFDIYNEKAVRGQRGEVDEYGKKFFKNAPFLVSDNFFVAIITPVVHYCMGGIRVNERAEVLTQEGSSPIAGLYAIGEVAGGVHGINRLGGNSLLDCVVYGRVAGNEVTRYLLSTKLGPGSRLDVIKTHLAGAAAPPPAAVGSAAAPAKSAGIKLRAITKDEVAKHNTEKDCWVIIGEQVLDVTKFMPDHPGGVRAIMLFAGKDATDEFDMLHKREVIEKYAADAVIGTLAK